MSSAPPPNLPLVQSYHPTTFAERGVAVPFTTPMLACARARPGERTGTELVVPNPGGGRGVYILPWAGVQQLCRPTLHDRKMNDRLALMPSVTPSSIRQAARAVAAEGLAGRGAEAAAIAAARVDEQDRLLTNFLLLLALVQQVEQPGENPVPPNQERPAELEKRAKGAIARIAPRLGQSPETVAGSLEELAQVFAAVGVGGQASQSRASRIVADLTTLRDQLSAWGRGMAARGGFDESGAIATMVVRVAELTLACTQATLIEARGLAGNLPALLARWSAERETVARIAARPDWLLDGWSEICALWQTAATDQARRAVLGDLTLMVPVIPKEAGDWVGITVEADTFLRLRRTVSLNQDWRTGTTVLERISRNEQVRALAA